MNYSAIWLLTSTALGLLAERFLTISRGARAVLIDPAQSGAVGIALVMLFVAPLSAQTMRHAGPGVFQENSGGRSAPVAQLLPIPSPEQQAAAERLIRELFADEYLDSTKSGQRSLSAKLQSHASTIADDPTGIYVLLREARSAAVRGDDVSGAFEAIQQLASAFDVDALALDASTVIEISNNAPQHVDAPSLVVSGLCVASAAEAAHRYDLMPALLRALANSARIAGDPELSKAVLAKTQEIDNYLAKTKNYEQSIAALKTAPDDPAMNLRAGQYECFVLGDWPSGLKHLAKSADTELKTLAEKDLAATGASANLEVAEAWYRYFQHDKSEAKLHAADRAEYWYEKCRANSTGLRRDLAEKRLRELNSMRKNLVSTPPVDKEVKTVFDDPGPGQTMPAADMGAAEKPRLFGIGNSPDVHRILYLCDSSGSMLGIFPRLKIELKNSIDKLEPAQAFNVIFCSDGDVTGFSQGNLVIANPDNKRKIYDWVDGISAHGGTNPMPAIEEAFKEKPELIYILTDGFDNISSFEALIAVFRKLNADHKIKINCIFLRENDDKALEATLTTITTENGGKLKIIDKKDMSREKSASGR